MNEKETNPPKWYEAFGIRDFILILHLPFTSVVISYVIIGNTLTNKIDITNLFLSVTIVFFILQSAHFLDEVKDYPWRTNLSKKQLLIPASIFLITSLVAGAYLATKTNLFMFFLVISGSMISPLYSLGILNNQSHNIYVFSIFWGALPFFGGYIVQKQTFSSILFIVATLIALNSGAIYYLYQKTKQKTNNKRSWKIIKINIILVNLIAILLVIRHLIPL